MIITVRGTSSTFTGSKVPSVEGSAVGPSDVLCSFIISSFVQGQVEKEEEKNDMR